MASSFVSQLGDLSPIASFIGWWFLPGLFSGILLRVYYRLRPSGRPEYPPSVSTSGTHSKLAYNPAYECRKVEVERRYRLHQSVAHGFVISVYLIYSLAHTYQGQLDLNYYSILGLRSNSLAFNSPLPGSVGANAEASPSSIPRSKKKQSKPSNEQLGNSLDEAGFKSHWRKLARSYHPDKLNPPHHLKTEEEVSLWKDGVQSKFIVMREAYEILSDEAKQWAYDRFGPAVAEWKQCATAREYLLEGLKHSCPFWIFTVASLSLMSSLRKSDPGAYWRYTCLLLVLLSELVIVTSARATPATWVLAKLFPDRAPFQYIELLRQMLIASSAVTTQLSSILYPDLTNVKSLREQNLVKEVIEPMLGLVERAEEASTSVNLEVIKLIFNDLHPIIRHVDDLAESLKHSASKTGGEADAPGQSDQGQDAKSKNMEGQPVLNELITDLKSRMLETFCDLKLQSDPNGQIAWVEAIQRQQKR